MKTLLLSVFASLLLSSSVFAAPEERDLKDVLDEIQDVLIKQKGVNGVGITTCDVFSLSEVAGLAHPAVAYPPQSGIAVYFTNADDMFVFARRAVNGELKIPNVVYCPMMMGEASPE